MLKTSGGSRLQTYNKQNSYAVKAMSFKNISNINVPNNKQQRSLKFSFNNKNYSIDINYNSNNVLLYNTIPQTELGYYFNDKGGANLDIEINNKLRAELDNFKTTIDKVRFLHRMVLQGIPYKTDEQQFGHEKWCLPEEVLKYPYADCEDRTFLLNYLIRTLLHLNTICLHYPMHVAMAVEVEGGEGLQKINYKGKQYIYCDPTYMGADIGKMPSEYVIINPIISY
jgi:hypothetical protein